MDCLCFEEDVLDRGKLTSSVSRISNLMRWDFFEKVSNPTGRSWVLSIGRFIKVIFNFFPLRPVTSEQSITSSLYQRKPLFTITVPLS